jgi:hypothetical protein
MTTDFEKSRHEVDGQWCDESRRMRDVSTLVRCRRTAHEQLGRKLLLPPMSVRWLESEADTVLTTMRQCIEAQDGRLELLASFHDVIIPIERFAVLDRCPELVDIWYRLDPS